MAYVETGPDDYIYTIVKYEGNPPQFVDYNYVVDLNNPNAINRAMDSLRQENIRILNSFGQNQNSTTRTRLMTIHKDLKQTYNVLKSVVKNEEEPFDMPFEDSMIQGRHRRARENLRNTTYVVPPYVNPYARPPPPPPPPLPSYFFPPRRQRPPTPEFLFSPISPLPVNEAFENRVLTENLIENTRPIGGPTIGSGINPWIAHVKKVQKQKGISYKEAMKIAKQSYK